MDVSRGFKTCKVYFHWQMFSRWVGKAKDKQMVSWILSLVGGEWRVEDGG